MILRRRNSWPPSPAQPRQCGGRLEQPLLPADAHGTAGPQRA